MLCCVNVQGWLPPQLRALRSPCAVCCCHLSVVCRNDEDGQKLTVHCLEDAVRLLVSVWCLVEMQMPVCLRFQTSVRKGLIVPVNRLGPAAPVFRGATLCAVY